MCLNCLTQRQLEIPGCLLLMACSCQNYAGTLSVGPIGLEICNICDYVIIAIGSIFMQQPLGIVHVFSSGGSMLHEFVLLAQDHIASDDGESLRHVHAVDLRRFGPSSAVPRTPLHLLCTSLHSDCHVTSSS